MPEIPDAADEIEVLRAANHNLEELQRGAGLNQLQIAHLPHPPTCQEAARSSLQPHRSQHLAGKHLPRRRHRDVHRLLDLLQLLARDWDLLGADYGDDCRPIAWQAVVRGEEGPDARHGLP